MSVGSKSTYLEKLKRPLSRFEESREKRALPDLEAKRRAWTKEVRMFEGDKKVPSARGYRFA